MAESQYSADSARDPHPFPRPLMPSSASRSVASLSVAAGGEPGVRLAFATVGTNVPAETASTSITLHN